MSKVPNIRFERVQIIPVTITGANFEAEVETTTDRNFEIIEAIEATVDNPVVFTGGGNYISQDFTVNGLVIYDRGFETKLLYSTTNVAAKERPRPVKHAQAMGSTVKFAIKDNGGYVANGNAQYTINVYLYLKNPEEAKS
jgi:hypothetical protein